MAKIHDDLQKIQNLAAELKLDIREISLTPLQWEEYTSESWRVQDKIEPKKASKRDKGTFYISVMS
jgi:hypothetical protein